MQPLNIIRANKWWSVIPPQILGWIYFCLLATHSPVTLHWQNHVAFFVSLISISTFGYLLNDFFDVEADKVAGKKNALAEFSIYIRLLFVILALGMGIVAWFFITPFRPGATALLALQIIALAAYSAPPLRLKEKNMAGILTDAFYGHINPVFIAITAYWVGYSQSNMAGLSLLALLFLCTTLKGIRNILLHQLDDRRKDRLSDIKTFVTQNGALFTLYFINNLLPFEILFTVLLVVLISYFFPPFFLSLLLFAVFTYLKFSGWKLSYLPKRQLKFKFLHFINDYYEGWIPVFFLILLSVGDNRFLIVLLLHLVLFPTFIIKLWEGIKTINQNFKTEDDY